MTSRVAYFLPTCFFCLATMMTPFAQAAPEDGVAGSGSVEITSITSSSSPLVAIRVLVRAGSQYDPPGKEGLAALTAAVISQGGTSELTYNEVLDRLYPMAASLDGACHKEIAIFSGVVHRDNLPEYEKLIAEMLCAPRMAAEDFQRVRTDAVNSITDTLRGGNDEELGKSALLLELYPAGHPYAHVDTGTVTSLKALTLEDVKQFHAAHYRRDAIRLGLAGYPGDAASSSLLARRMAALPADAPAAPELKAPVMPTGIEIGIVSKPTADSTAISMGFPLDITRSDDDFYALAVANSYLGEHRTFNGKLMQDLRGKRGLNYGDYSYIEDFIQDGGSTFPVPNNPRRQQAFTIWLRPVPHDKAAFAIRAALWELDRLLREGISPEDNEATRSYLLNYSKLWVQTLDRRLGYEMEGAEYGRKSLVQELQERLPGLKVEDVNAAVRKHLKTSGIRMAIVTRDAEGLAEQLRSGKPTPITYDTEGTPEDVLAEDKVIAAFPLSDVKIEIKPVQEMFER